MKRYRFRFGLRTLLLGVGGMSIALGLVMGIVNRLRIEWLEHHAKVEVSKLGGTYTMASVRLAKETNAEPGWIYSTFLNRVAEIELSPQAWPAVERRAAGQPSPPITDDHLPLLRNFVWLRALDLHDSETSDRGLEHLKQLQHLEKLDLRGTKVSEHGVRELRSALPNCEILPPVPPR